MKTRTDDGGLREDARNKLLRRADWRFLLPNPQPAKSICFADGLLGRAVEAISGSVVDSRTDSSPNDCDLAVVLNASLRTLQEAWTSLRPGASCYAEWYLPLPGGANGIRRRLEQAGFRDVTCYWCWPWPVLSPPRYWLPLGAPGALRHFAASTSFPQNAIRRFTRAVLRTVGLLCVRIGFALPICAVARKPASDRHGHTQSDAVRASPRSTNPADVARATPELLRTIRTEWKNWGLGATPDALSALVLTGGSRAVSKVVALVFAEPAPRPKLAVKMARVPEAVPGLLREATTLRFIQSLRPGAVPGAPQILFCYQQAGFIAVGETALAGRPLAAAVRRSTFRDLAHKGTGWLSGLAGRPAVCPREAWWERLVEPVVARFDELFGPVIDGGMLRDARDIMATLGPLPLVCEQRDFAPWNTLITLEGELAVLDWESAEPQGLPAMDLIYFLTYLTFSLDRAHRLGGWRHSYRATLDPSTFVGAARRECLARYADQIGLSDAAIGPLRLLIWMLHARSEYDRFAADIAGRPGREILRRSLFVSLWEEELRDVSGARLR
jgi:hypothetical protein